MKNNIQHGNQAKITSNPQIIPAYATNTITPKKIQTDNDVPETISQNVTLSKEFVDENHK